MIAMTIAILVLSIINVILVGSIFWFWSCILKRMDGTDKKKTNTKK